MDPPNCVVLRSSTVYISSRASTIWSAQDPVKHIALTCLSPPIVAFQLTCHPNYGSNNNNNININSPNFNITYQPFIQQQPHPLLSSHSSFYAQANTQFQFPFLQQQLQQHQINPQLLQQYDFPYQTQQHNQEIEQQLLLQKQLQKLQTTTPTWNDRINIQVKKQKISLEQIPILEGNHLASPFSNTISLPNIKLGLKIEKFVGNEATIKAENDGIIFDGLYKCVFFFNKPSCSLFFFVIY